MAESTYVCFDRLRLGVSPQHIVGRLLRSWEARNINKNGELMGIVVLLVDEKGLVIHAFIPAAQCDRFRSLLSDGVIYTIKDFDVGRCNNHYKITEHPFVVRFLPHTSIVRNGDFAREILEHKFMFRSLEQLNQLANTNLEFPDVVGQIVYAQGSNLDDPTSTQQLVVRLKITLTDTLRLTLWDDAAATFRSLIALKKTKQAVMIATGVNPKLFGGQLRLNSTTGTRFYFDQKIPEIHQFIQSLSLGSDVSFRCVDTTNGVAKKELLSIKELHSYVANTNEQSQEADFLCNAFITEVPGSNGWSYVSCSKCNRKLEKYGSELRCTRCISPHVTGVVRYRVELNVHDEEDAATFVVFDTPMTALLSKTAATLTLRVESILLLETSLALY